MERREVIILRLVQSVSRSWAHSGVSFSVDIVVVSIVSGLFAQYLFHIDFDLINILINAFRILIDEYSRGKNTKCAVCR